MLRQTFVAFINTVPKTFVHFLIALDCYVGRVNNRIKMDIVKYYKNDLLLFTSIKQANLFKCVPVKHSTFSNTLRVSTQSNSFLKLLQLKFQKYFVFTSVQLIQNIFATKSCDKQTMSEIILGWLTFVMLVACLGFVYFTKDNGISISIYLNNLLEFKRKYGNLTSDKFLSIKQLL